MPDEATELLFSYGTLRLEAVQRATFGRLLDGRADSLPCYTLTMLAIDDAEVVATSGESHHPIVRRTGLDSDEVPGMVFQVTREEIQHSDRYEVAAYQRVEAVLRSGERAWVYVDANQ